MFGREVPWAEANDSSQDLLGSYASAAATVTKR